MVLMFFALSQVHHTNWADVSVKLPGPPGDERIVLSYEGPPSELPKACAQPQSDHQQ